MGDKERPIWVTSDYPYPYEVVSLIIRENVVQANGNPATLPPCVAVCPHPDDPKGSVRLFYTEGYDVRPLESQIKERLNVPAVQK